MPIAESDLQLAKEIQRYYDDPLGFILDAFPWGQPGPLENYPGPDANQREFLNALGAEVKARGFDGVNAVRPIRMAATSGHGTGKSAMGAWISCWILSTRPGSKGTVTAGTATQLAERTWAAIQWWMKLCITRDWFEVFSTGIYAKEDPENWKLMAQTCKEENAQSFAGQHASNSTSWYLFDEASTVPEGVWSVAFGGLTDGEPMFFAWGQPERNTGRFYEICFGSERERWNHRTLDSRTSDFTNKELIKEWATDYGEDSDWFRVRVLGLPPRADELQYIDKGRIDAAQQREAWTAADEPLIAGFDVSGGGKAWNVIRFRRGLDGRTRPPVRMNGATPRETLISVAADLLSNRDPKQRIAMLFVDSAFGSPIVERLRVLGHHNVVEVNFGGQPPDIHCLNMRAYMYKRMKDWLLTGALPKEEQLMGDLSAPGYRINNSGKLVIEAKQDIAKRLGRSTDDGDALALTFAQSVAPPQTPKGKPPAKILSAWS